MTTEKLIQFMYSIQNQMIADYAPRYRTQYMKVTDEVIAILEKVRFHNITACGWGEEEFGNWETDCGKCWQLTDGTPEENEMKFCPFCGLELRVNRRTEVK
jgi:hypothetical protein